MRDHFVFKANPPSKPHKCNAPYPIGTFSNRLKYGDGTIWECRCGRVWMLKLPGNSTCNWEWRLI